MVSPSIVNNPPKSEQDFSIRYVQWLLTTANPIGVPVSMPEWADKTWDIDGTSLDPVNGQLTWGSVAATCAVQGANNLATNGQLQNPQTLNNAAGGTPISATTNKVAASIENPMFLSPQLSTPGTGAIVQVTLVLRRNNTMRK